MAEFNPDEYLKSDTTVSEFNPDAYLAEGEKKNSAPSVSATNGSLSESVNGGLGGIEQIAPKKDNYVTLSGQNKPLDALNAFAFSKPKELTEESYTIPKRKAKEREPLKNAYLAAQQNPDRDSHYQLGQELLKIGDYGRAIDAFDKAATLPKKLTETQIQDQAFNQQIASGDDNLSYSIGLAYDKLGKKSDAERMFKVAIEKNPDNIEARKALAYTAYKEGNKEKASKYLNEAHEAENKLITAQSERVGESEYEIQKAKQANLIVQAAEAVILGDDPEMKLDLISPIAFAGNFYKRGKDSVLGAAKDIKQAIDLSSKFGDVEAAKLAPAKLISGGIKLGFAAMKVANPAEFAAWELGTPAAEAVLPEFMVQTIMQPATTILGGSNNSELKKTINESLDVFGNLLLFHKLTGAANKFKRNEPLTPKETQEVTEVLQNVKPKEIEKAVEATQEKQALEVRKTELSDNIEIAEKALSIIPEKHETLADEIKAGIHTDMLKDSIKKDKEELTKIVKKEVEEEIQSVQNNGNIQQPLEVKPIEADVAEVGEGAVKEEIKKENEAKKADIEIGKVSNTEYEVKVDGVYYQGKKLNNPENKTHRQLIEADIKRRKQEELNTELDKKAKDIPVKREYYKDSNGNDITVTTYRAGNKTFTFTESNNIAADNFEDLDLQSTIPYKTEEVTSKLENKINAKYDAEFEELEIQAKAVEQSLKAEDKAPVTKPEGKSDVVVDKESNVGGDVEATTKALDDIGRTQTEEGDIIDKILLQKSKDLREEDGTVSDKNLKEFKDVVSARASINAAIAIRPKAQGSKERYVLSNKEISEAYHKAKADGTNPELVKAVEQSLSPTKSEPAVKEETSTVSDVSGDVKVQDSEYKGITGTTSVNVKEKDGIIKATFKGTRSDKPNATIGASGYRYGGKAVKETLSDFEKDYGVKVDEIIDGVDIAEITVLEERAEVNPRQGVGTGQSVTLRIRDTDGNIINDVNIAVNKRKFTEQPKSENKPIQNEPIKEPASSTTVSSEEEGSGVGGDVEIKNEGKADAPTKESVTERLSINNPFYKKVEDALVKLGLIEKYNAETGTGDVVGGYAQQTSDGGFSVGKMLFSQDGSISYFDGDVKVSFDKNGNVISENTKEAKQKAVSLEIESKKASIANFEKTRDSESFKYKEVTETDVLGNKKKVKRLKTEQELKESTDKINAAIDKAKAELSNLEQPLKETTKAGSVGVGGDVEFTAKGGNEVVDEKGEPLVVHHFSESEIKEFDQTKIQKNKSMYGDGFYFTDNAKSGAGIKSERSNRVDVVLNMKNPKIHYSKDDHIIGMYKPNIGRIGEHDGLIIIHPDGEKTYVVKDKSQIKIINSKSDENIAVEVPLETVGKNIVYRGIDKRGFGGNGAGVAGLGKGLYTTNSKEEAQKYAWEDGRTKGKPIALKNAKPINPLVLNDGNVQKWVDENLPKSKYKNESDFRDNLSEYVTGLGYDGIAIKSSDGVEIYVKYTEQSLKETTKAETPSPENGGQVSGQEGGQGDVKFTSDVSIPFTYKLIESDNLQASHLPSGERNPEHLIASAQPKERNDLGSRVAQDKIAANPNLKEVGENVNAYSGAPIVNERGEVIQGNNRSIGLKKHYENSGTSYKEQLLKDAEKFGLTKEQVAGMKNPVLVRELKVGDQEAIKLGQHDVKDLETGGKQSIDAIATSRKISPKDKSKLTSILFGGDFTTLKEAIRENSKAVANLIKGYINPAQFKNTFNSDGTFTAKGMDDISDVVTHFLFEDGNAVLPEVFEGLPSNIQKGLQKALPHILSLEKDNSLISDIQKSMLALHDFYASGNENFDEWANSVDMFIGEAPNEIFTPIEITLAKKFHNAKNQVEIKNIFQKHEELINGREANLIDEAVEGLSKKEAIETQFKIKYDENKQKPNTKPKSEDNNEKPIKVENQENKDRKGSNEGNKPLIPEAYKEGESKQSKDEKGNKKTEGEGLLVEEPEKKTPIRPSQKENGVDGKEEGKKKTLVTYRSYEGDVREGVKKELEKIGLTRDVDVLEVAQKQANEFVKNVGERAALDAIRNGDVEGATAAYIFDAITQKIDKRLSIETDTDVISELEKIQAELLNEWGNKQWKSGAFNSAMQKILAESDLGYNITKKIEDYKKINNGTIPADVEAKFKEYDSQLKEINKKIAEAEERALDAENKLAIKNIQEAISRNKVKKDSATFTKKAKEAADRIRKFKSKPIEFKDENGNTIDLTANGITWNELVENIAKTVEKTGKIADAITDVLKELKVSDATKKAIKEQLEEHFGDINTDGKIKIPHELIKDLVEKGVDNIDDLVKAVKKETDIDATDREIRDAITGYGKKINATRPEIEGKINELNRVGRLLSELEDLQKGIRKEVNSVKKEKLSIKEKDLKDKIKQLSKEVPFTEAELSKINEKTLERKKSYAENRIAELKTKLKEGDFSKRVKNEITDTELNKLNAEKLRIKGDYDKAFYKAKLQNRTKAELISDSLWELWGLTRLLSATGEFSFVGVQGLTLTIRAALRNPKVLKEAFAKSIETFRSESKTEYFLNNLKSQEWYPELKASKLSITEPHAELTARDELMVSDYANLLWNVVTYPTKLISKSAYEKVKTASPFKAFERASVGYLDTLRIKRWLDGKNMLEAQGMYFKDNPEAYKQMADVINTFTGRASLGVLEPVSKPLTKIFFSPRLWASQFKTATPYALYHFGKMRAGADGWKPTVAQKMAFMDLATQIGLTTSILMMIKAWDDDLVETDPRSSDFMKVKLGDTRVDPWGSKIQQVVFMSRLAAESVKRNGEVIPLGIPNKTPNRLGLILEQAQNKLAPTPSILVKYASTHVNEKGERLTPYGQEFKMTDELLNSLHPIYFETVKELAKDGVNITDPLLAAYAFFGGGVNVQNKKETKTSKNLELK